MGAGKKTKSEEVGTGPSCRLENRVGQQRQGKREARMEGEGRTEKAGQPGQPSLGLCPQVKRGRSQLSGLGLLLQQW